MKRTKQSYFFFGGTLFATAILLFALQAMTTFTFDDYYYSQFWREGFSRFAEMNVYHYLTRNGRVLVHLVAETFLASDTAFYGLCNTLILSGISLLFFRFSNHDQKDGSQKYLSALTIFCLLVLGTNYRVLKSWIFCIADSANYLFPFLLIGLLMYLMDRPRRASLLLYICAFLCGATTELCGSMAFILVLLYGLHRFWKEKRINWQTLVVLICICAGIITIFLSPATLQRVGEEFSFKRLATSFVQYANSFAAPGTSLKNLILLCVLMGVQPAICRANKIMYSGLPVGSLLAASYFIPRSVIWTAICCLVFFAYVLICSAVMLCSEKHCRCAFMLLAGLCSSGIVMLSKSCSIRVTTPFLLMVILCSTHYIIQIFSRLGEKKRGCACAFPLWLPY